MLKQMLKQTAMFKQNPALMNVASTWIQRTFAVVSAVYSLSYYLSHVMREKTDKKFNAICKKGGIGQLDVMNMLSRASLSGLSRSSVGLSGNLSRVASQVTFCLTIFEDPSQTSDPVFGPSLKHTVFSMPTNTMYA